MDVIDEEIYKCLDELDTLLIKDLSQVNHHWKQEDESEEKKNSVQVLHCINRFLETSSTDSLKNNSNLLFILKCIFQKHRLLFENLDYDQVQFNSNDDLPIESYSLRKYWRQLYPSISRSLIENLIHNKLDCLSDQFKFSETLEFFLLIERTEFWHFYQQKIRKERLIMISRTCGNIESLVEQLIKTLEYEIFLVCDYRYLQNLMVEYSDFILNYSNVIKSTVIDRLDRIKNESNIVKVNTLLTTLAQLNRFDQVIKANSKKWTKLDLLNSVTQKRIQFDWKEYFIRRDYFNFLLNELNKELHAVTDNLDESNLRCTQQVEKTEILASFVTIIQVLDRYNIIYVKQLKKSFMVIVEVNINQFVQIKFSKLLKRVQLKQIHLYLNTLYYVKEHLIAFSGFNLNKIDELISDLECEFKAKNLFVINSNICHIEYVICYLSAIQIDLLNSVNYNLSQAQKMYQDLIQQTLLQLEDRDLQNDDLILLLSNLPDLLMFAYDNENLFAFDSKTSFKKIVNKFCWKALYQITLLNASIETLTNELSKFDHDKFNTLDKHNWLELFNPNLHSNLVYYHALICNRKSTKHFVFICRPFLEFKFKFTVDLLSQLIKQESLFTFKIQKKYRNNRNRLLKAIFNLIISSLTRMQSLSSIVLSAIQSESLNFDSIQFELLLDDSLSVKHSSKLNQLDWIFSIVKIVKSLISSQFEIILNSLLYKYTDLINLIELDSSIQHLLTNLNLKFLISENYFLNEFTDSIFKLICDSVLIIPNSLFYSLELIGKDLKSNELLVFNSLIAHIILFAICKLLKSRLKVLIKNHPYTVLYGKIVNNLLLWLTFPNDHNLTRYQNRFNELMLRRRMNLNIDHVQVDENQELELLFRTIESNYEFYSKDIELLDCFLALNDDYLNARLTNEEFKGELNLDFFPNARTKKSELNVTTIYKRSKSHSRSSIKHLNETIDYQRILRLMRIKTTKTFIKTNLVKRSDFKCDNQVVDELKKIFQIA